MFEDHRKYEPSQVGEHLHYIVRYQKGFFKYTKCEDKLAIQIYLKEVYETMQMPLMHKEVS